MSAETTESFNRTLLAAERVIAALRDESSGRGAMSLDITEYEAALADLRAAAEALAAVVEGAESTSVSPCELIDLAAWRAAQLVLFFFALLALYRWAAPRLAARGAG